MQPRSKQERATPLLTTIFLFVLFLIIPSHSFTIGPSSLSQLKSSALSKPSKRFSQDVVTESAGGGKNIDTLSGPKNVLSTLLLATALVILPPFLPSTNVPVAVATDELATTAVVADMKVGDVDAVAEPVVLDAKVADVDAVEEAVGKIRAAAGDAKKSFQAFEDVNAIITEGKGVGGSLSYTGVTLERGLVSDEDTTVYNPGLTLLTESEKTSLVSSIVENRKIGLSSNAWSEENELAYQSLKQNLDPLHMTELRGYLGVLPFFGAVVYLGVLAVQQNWRDVFPIAYFLGAFLVFGPIVALVVFGS